MPTPHKCPHCGNLIENEPFHSRGPSGITYHLAMIAAFLSGGWALLASGHTYWGGASLVAAVIAPPLHDFLTRYQQQYSIRAGQKREQETARLLEVARRHAAEASSE